VVSNACLRDYQRRALPTCDDCHGEGTVTYTARNIHGEVEALCACLDRAGSFEEQEPQPAVPPFPQRYRSGGYGSMVDSDGGSWLRLDDVLAYLKALGVEVPRG